MIFKKKIICIWGNALAFWGKFTCIKTNKLVFGANTLLSARTVVYETNTAFLMQTQWYFWHLGQNSGILGKYFSMLVKYNSIWVIYSGILSKYSYIFFFCIYTLVFRANTLGKYSCIGASMQVYWGNTNLNCCIHCFLLCFIFLLLSGVIQ